MRIKSYKVCIFLFLSMTGTALGFGQTSQVADLATRLNDYSRQHFQEKIFAHTDKSFYVCGETLWFKLYNTDARLNQPVSISKLAYVELYNSEKKPVLQAKTDLNDGSGSGSFLLPFSLNSGVYVLRVYTNWMKNFDPGYFFEKPITVINTLKKLPAPAILTNTFGIQFFPEGGNLVAGIENKLAFHAVDLQGKGVDCKGVIVDQNNDTVTSFSSARFGMGNFLFTPLIGYTYKAVVQSGEGAALTRDLPLSFETGYVIRLHALPDKQTLRVTVHTAGLEDGPVSLLVHTRQAIKYGQMKDLVNGITEFMISKKDLGEGISHFTLFNHKQQPVCERLYFRQPEKKLNLETSPHSENYGVRQKVTIAISTKDTGGLATPANLSLSVFRVDSLQCIDQDDIKSYLWLSSELRGNIESPASYFSPDIELAEEAADDLMLIHGWSRFKWETVLNNTHLRYPFLPEYEGPVVTGRILENNTGLPARNISTYLSITGERFAFASCTSDQNGNIFFNPGKFYGSNTIIVQPRQKSNSSYQILINSPFAENFSARTYPPLAVSEKWKRDILSRNIETQVENTYVADKKQHFYLPNSADSTAFYGKPDKTYWLDDYTRFISLEEVMREYVGEVRVRKQEDGFLYKVKNGSQNIFFNNDPLILLDGMPVFDIEKLMNYDPLKIKRLDVVTRKYFLGNTGVEGIVSYITYNGRMEGFEKDPQAIILDYPGIQLQREFYSPLYETEEQTTSPIPDFRNVLFWSPEIRTDEKGSAELSFYTSDRPGRYAVVVQGLDSNGLAGSKTIFFTVTK